MAFLRFIIVLLTCTFFATASVAGGMMCCQDSHAKPEKASETQDVLPCHEKATVKSGDEGHDAKNSADTIVKGCQCACSLQLVKLPEIDLIAETAPFSKPDTVLAQLFLRLSPTIEIPPKKTS